MPFKPVPITVASGENKSRSSHWASQSCVNMYIDKQRTGRTESALMPWPGEKSFSSGTAGVKTRGMWSVAGTPYIITDTNLYSIDSAGRQTQLATIPGFDYVSFADDGVNLIIRLDGTAAYINGKFILQGPGNTFIWDGSALRAIPIPTMNSDEALVSDVDLPEVYRYSPIKSQITGGDFKQVFKYNQKLFFAGESFIDVYFDSEGGDPPIRPSLQASSTRIGVASKSSMAQTPSYLYMLGNDGVAYRISNFEPSSITPSSISRIFRENDTSQALGMTCQIDGQWFYIVQLRDSGPTLAYSESTGEWIRLSSGVDLPPGPHVAQGYVFAYGKHLVADKTSSSVYEWDFETYTSNGGPIVREFITAPINGLMVGEPGSRLVMNRARFVMENGVGNANEFNPQMMVQASFDGGRTFSTENNVFMNRAGDSTTLVEWDSCHTFYDMSLKVRVTDPVFSSFHSAVIYLKSAGY